MHIRVHAPAAVEYMMFMLCLCEWCLAPSHAYTRARTGRSGGHDVHGDELHDAGADARDGECQEDAAFNEHGRQGLFVGQALGVEEAHHVVPAECAHAMHACRAGAGCEGSPLRCTCRARARHACL